MRVLARTLSIEFKSEKFVQKQRSITFNQYICHKNDILKYATALLNAVWPLDPCRTISLKLNNMRYRLAKDLEGPVLGEGKLTFFMGKGRKKGCLTTAESLLMSNLNSDQLQPTLSAMLYHERKKDKEERYKKLIGQQDIKNFFVKKGQEGMQSEQRVEEEENSYEEEFRNQSAEGEDENRNLEDIDYEGLEY